ncbi:MULTISPECIES: hypothetical protein [Halomonas]|uniref:hypothetical protein n=1 Tax=Halomonas TaxID=2745 RepID=UPI0018688815|nr:MULTISPECIES: hypothetical protein [Halomonas]
MPLMTLKGAMVNLGVASVFALGCFTFIQHQQISALSDQLERYPQLAVVDVGELGALMALSNTDTAGERQVMMAETLSILSSEGFLIVDQQNVLTAPRHSLIKPETLLESAGIEVSQTLRDDIDLPPRPASQPSGGNP